jgi:hypothetical protein
MNADIIAGLLNGVSHEERKVWWAVEEKIRMAAQVNHKRRCWGELKHNSEHRDLSAIANVIAKVVGSSITPAAESNRNPSRSMIKFRQRFRSLQDHLRI